MNKQKRKFERELAYRAIFQIGFEADDMSQIKDKVLATLNNGAGFEQLENSEEGIISSDKYGYARLLVETVINHLQSIDREIGKYLKKDWRFDRIPNAEIAVMRIGAAEMMYLDLPIEVAVNEAVEIAKKYCDEKSYRYINGILNNLGKNLQQIQE
ncbi:transcription antitermination factor NusB [Pseudoramibacter sp.]|jgi:N utilization substance protein B|uniref:transcription antitermination factor NusB n=1 Tax=Pseudoramibacter sp. TaxID=2034862 RepID=UPI0025FBBC3D|nr:transcription antitermination factor NusB [Pseudoramibacter sp.]MCH4072898.1 transcription antitermination factor NusB [Pseudoramibacter sp.]MCH4106669.1 transcription antitermination factor NusB [Pseudoramibacter sp.]